jgi:hypothetical protein
VQPWAGNTAIRTSGFEAVAALTAGTKSAASAFSDTILTSETPCFSRIVFAASTAASWRPGKSRWTTPTLVTWRVPVM